MGFSRLAPWFHLWMGPSGSNKTNYSPWCVKGTYGGDPLLRPRPWVPDEPTTCCCERGSRGGSGTDRTEGAPCRPSHPFHFCLVSSFHQVSLPPVLSASALSQSPQRDEEVAVVGFVEYGTQIQKRQHVA